MHFILSEISGKYITLLLTYVYLNCKHLIISDCLYYVVELTVKHIAILVYFYQIRPVIPNKLNTSCPCPKITIVQGSEFICILLIIFYHLRKPDNRADSNLSSWNMCSSSNIHYMCYVKSVTTIPSPKVTTTTTKITKCVLLYVKLSNQIENKSNKSFDILSHIKH